MRISDWSSDVCSSDLKPMLARPRSKIMDRLSVGKVGWHLAAVRRELAHHRLVQPDVHLGAAVERAGIAEFLRQLLAVGEARIDAERSEEHTSVLQSLMRISYAAFCLKTQKKRLQRLTIPSV